jgi:hypothetical protein
MECVKNQKSDIQKAEVKVKLVRERPFNLTIGVCIPYFSRIPAILLINKVLFALAFADSHSSICFSIVESSLAIPKK